jgi:hypothetical protein
MRNWILTLGIRIRIHHHHSSASVTTALQQANVGVQKKLELGFLQGNRRNGKEKTIGSRRRGRIRSPRIVGRCWGRWGLQTPAAPLLSLPIRRPGTVEIESRKSWVKWTGERLPAYVYSHCRRAEGADAAAPPFSCSLRSGRSSWAELRCDCEPEWREREKEWRRVVSLYIPLEEAHTNRKIQAHI